MADVCRQTGIAEATFYLWKKKFGSLGVPEVRELRQMREENARLKRLVADLTLDKQILQEVIRKKAVVRVAPNRLLINANVTTSGTICSSRIVMPKPTQ